MQHNYRQEQPERFAQAVRACCGIVCDYPACGCTGTPWEIEKAIHAWETLPHELDINGVRGGE